MSNPAPDKPIDLKQITSRNETARQIIAGFATDMPTIAEVWQHLQAALADTPALVTDVTRLSADLKETRLDRANLLAAVRAAIGAHADGEPDPLCYLRNELDARQQPSHSHGRAS